MNRYLVSFWQGGVYLGYVSVWADSETQAETKARTQQAYKGWNDTKYVVNIEKC